MKYRIDYIITMKIEAENVDSAQKKGLGVMSEIGERFDGFSDATELEYEFDYLEEQQSPLPQGIQEDLNK